RLGRMAGPLDAAGQPAARRRRRTRRGAGGRAGRLRWDNNELSSHFLVCWSCPDAAKSFYARKPFTKAGDRESAAFVEADCVGISFGLKRHEGVLPLHECDHRPADAVALVRREHCDVPNNSMAASPRFNANAAHECSPRLKS